MRGALTVAIIMTLAFAAHADSPQPIYGGLNNNAGLGSIGNIGLLQIGITTSGSVGPACSTGGRLNFASNCNTIFQHNGTVGPF